MQANYRLWFVQEGLGWRMAEDAACNQEWNHRAAVIDHWTVALSGQCFLSIISAVAELLLRHFVSFFFFLPGSS